MNARYQRVGFILIGTIGLAGVPAVALATTSPGPAICGKTCSLDSNGTPYCCSNGSCTCASGYDTVSNTDGSVACQPSQPEVTGSESDDYSCAGICPGAVPWATVGSIYNAFGLVPVHGTAPGGEAFMPVWGYQATQCGNSGVGARCTGGGNNGGICGTSADCPDGTCTLAGTCQGGSMAGLTCFRAGDCAGTCGAMTTGFT